MPFSLYKQSKLSKGDALLRKTQAELAIESKHPGMLIWLGKNRLGQKDTPTVNYVQSATAGAAESALISETFEKLCRKGLSRMDALVLINEVLSDLPNKIEAYKAVLAQEAEEVKPIEISELTENKTE